MRVLRLGLVGVGDLRRAGERDDALEHIDEGAGKRQVGPARVAGDVEQHDQALAAPRRGDERSAVGERRPGVLGERRIRLGQHLAADGYVIGHGHAVERALVGKRGERLRLVPAQTAAERAPAAPQLDRNKIVVGGGKARAGEPHEHAAILDPARQAIMRLAGDIADIGEDQHRQVLVDEMRHRRRRRFALRQPDIGERPERPADVVARGEQRLRRIGGRAGDDADGAAAPAFVEQLHGAGRMLAGNLDPGDVIADFDRQIESRLGLAILGLERERSFAERQALEIERAHRAGLGRAGGGAQHFHAQRADGIFGRR